jgi:hypothetical protein
LMKNGMAESEFIKWCQIIGRRSKGAAGHADS